MHNHLALVKTRQPEIQCPSDLDVILSQALLMDAGSITFKSIKSGEVAVILAGLVGLAYTALQTLARQDNEGIILPTSGCHQEYQMLAIMRLLSKKIHDCSSGEAKDYCELYHLCASLASGFLNADFDKAFQVYHDWRIACRDSNTEVDDTYKLHKTKCPDLTDCLYE